MTYSVFFVKFFEEIIFIFLKIFALFCTFFAFLHKNVECDSRVFRRNLSKRHFSFARFSDFEGEGRAKIVRMTGTI